MSENMFLTAEKNQNEPFVSLFNSYGKNIVFKLFERLILIGSIDCICKDLNKRSEHKADVIW